jgi:hypothetical protein
MLKTSLYIMLASGESEKVVHLEWLAKRHSRAQFDIKPSNSMVCGSNRLVRAVREFDPMFDIEIETAWRRLLQRGIDFMKARY